MFVTALCPTFRRPNLLANSLAQFVGQDYPKDSCELIILDDAQQIEEQQGENWKVISAPSRYPSLTTKYNAMVATADPRTDVFVVWEDDDIYLPWHISAHAASMRQHIWSKPHHIYACSFDNLESRQSGLSYYASMGVRKEHWGLENTKRADFDQAYMARLSAKETAADTQDYSPGHISSYVFRWETTRNYHGQGVMKSMDDETWYDHFSDVPAGDKVKILLPVFDQETIKIWSILSERANFVAKEN